MDAHHRNRQNECVQTDLSRAAAPALRHGTRYRVDMIIDLALLLAVLIAMSISRPIQSLYWDDLSYFSLYHNSSIQEFIFNTSMDKFRPVANVFLWLCYSLTGGGGYSLYVTIIFVLFLAVATVYFMGRQIGGNRYIGLLVGFLYAISRCSYYQLNQVFGIMEVCTTLFSALSLFCMYRFLYEKGETALKRFALAALFAVLGALSHERFLCLYIVLFLAALMNLPKKNWHRIVVLGLPVFLCVLNLGIRNALLAQPFAGTGGTNMLSSINILQILFFFLVGLVSLFGFNMGAAYLFGINELELLKGYPFPAAPVFVVLAFLFALSVTVLVFLAFRRVLRYQEKAEKQTALKTYLLFILFVGGTLASACFTVRLELRWLYAPYVGCLFVLAYSLGILLDTRQISADEKNHSRWIAGALAVLLLSVVPLEVFYRTQIHRIAYIREQVAVNSLYSQTIEKYGRELYAHPIVILSPDGEASGLSQSYCDLFFDQYSFELFDKTEVRPTARIYFISSVQELAALENGSLIFDLPYIYSLTSDNRSVYGVSEVTNLILPMIQEAHIGQTLRTAVLEEGFYPWEANLGWIHTQQKAILQIRTGTEHTMTLTANTYEMNLPNVLRVYFNGQLIAERPLTTTDVSFTVQSDLIPEDTVGTVVLELEHITSDYKANGGADRRPTGLTISELVFE